MTISAPRAGDPIGGAIILAAGSGTRFGADKRRATLPSGITLLAATVQRYAEVFDHLIVMLRDDEHALAETLYRYCAAPTQTIAFAQRASGGMGYTLADAIAIVPNTWQFVFIALGDMPFITHTTLRRLRGEMIRSTSASPAGCIVQPLCNATPGHPVGFSRVFFSELAALTEDRGARSVVQAHAGALRRIVLDDSGIVTDVDTPAALPTAH